MRQQDFHHIIKADSRYKTKKEIEALCYRALIDSYSRVRLIKGIASLSENGIRDKFVIDLEQQNAVISHPLDNCIIKIIPESYDAFKRRRTDIQFFLPINKRSITIECKKLSSAERRYVDDGLTRFIELAYAANDKDAGMIGFVVSPRFAVIVSKVKEMVGAFHIISFHNQPLFNYEHSFRSIHGRTNSSSISISHLFFKFD